MRPTRPEAEVPFPALGQLIGIYFNEDWFEEFETEADALADYNARFSTSARRQALAELIELRQVDMTDEQLGAAFSDMGSAYGPRGPWQPYHDFTDRLIALLSGSLQT